tara:strand:- start:213841 stop:214182 length:342 start_codon:yes stop_codon:yes gene_type:complete
MLPLIGNILMVTIPLKWIGTPNVLPFLLLLDLILLWQYWDFFRPQIDERKSSYDVKSGSMRTRNGYLVWLASLAFQFSANQVSFWNWPATLTTVILGMILSALSSRVDRTPSL